MRPLNRKPVNKRRSSKQFNKRTSRTHPKNLGMLMRGGYRA